MIKGSKIFKVTVSGGKVDPKPFNKYEDWKNAIENNTFASGGEEDEGTTPYQLKAKANYRWMIMSQNLQKGLDTLSNIKINGGSSSDVPGSVEFILTYTQPDGLWVEVDESEYVDNDPEIIKTSNDRVLFLGSKAIKRIIENTLKQKYEVILTYFSTDEVEKEHESSLAKGTVMKELTVEAVSDSTITVEEFEELSGGYREFVE